MGSALLWVVPMANLPSEKIFYLVKSRTNPSVYWQQGEKDAAQYIIEQGDLEPDDLHLRHYLLA